MRALGRPNRDQIVTSRPNELTTLEAINLANGKELNNAVAVGAKSTFGSVSLLGPDVALVRPAVEAGEKLGYLPGDISEKIDPYLMPLYDALRDMLDPQRVQQMIEEGFIEIAPLAYMRGRTLNDSFIILDEAQNSTREQMKMFLTRLGFRSKMVITGDVTQIDLPKGSHSGLIHARDILKKIKGIRFIHFNENDVVRHELVKKIIIAYED